MDREHTQRKFACGNEIVINVPVGFALWNLDMTALSMSIEVKGDSEILYIFV